MKEKEGACLPRVPAVVDHFLASLFSVDSCMAERLVLKSLNTTVVVL